MQELSEMPMSIAPRLQPAVSIILPTYNRARFLPEAIQSIREQTWTDWELIIVDDGSTDETPELLPRLTADIAQPVRIIRQENLGAYAARNTGLDHAGGNYIAFFDSDDLWLPHHLKDCAEALDANPDVDWVYGASRIVDNVNGAVLSDNCFYRESAPRPFLALAHRTIDGLHIFDDPAKLECMIRFGFFCGLQCSVIRTSVFGNRRFRAIAWHEGEDRIFALRVAATGGGFAYFNDVHLIYRVHAQNSSGSSIDSDPHKTREILRTLVSARRQLLRELPLTKRERAAMRYRISCEEFWGIGYSSYWQRGFRAKAIAAYLSAIRMYPWDRRYWKTLLLCMFHIGTTAGRV